MSVSTPSNNDIPTARRQSSPERPAAAKKPRSRWLGRFFGVLGLSAIATLTIWQWQPISQQTQQIQSAILSRKSAANAQKTAPPTADPQSAPPAEAPIPVQSPNPIAIDGPDRLLDHRRYEEANPADLVNLNPNSELKLQAPVQIAVNEMIASAKAEGVQLGIASAFRSVEDQNRLFFDIKAERGQSPTARAEVSAPPGYSEHHTGYAVDFIDESKPGTHTDNSFETTPAFQWLQQNAAAYSFEMSFPKDSNSSVSYEPWHWRYVGDRKSLELFYQEQSPAEPPQ